MSATEQNSAFCVSDFARVYENFFSKFTSLWVPDLYNAANIDSLRSSADSKLKILDVASGTGAVALYLAERHPRDEIIASDMSKQMLHYLDLKIEQNNIPNISTVVANMTVRFSTSSLSTIFIISIDIIY
jgi:ubiquinone/menaquinone biosynthesis C-methylase UbiE